MSKELVALKMTSDLLTVGLEALMSAQKINSFLAQVQSENRKITDAEWSQLHSNAEGAFLNLRLALAKQ